MRSRLGVALILIMLSATAANAGMTFNFSGPSGQTSASATFTLLDSTHLEIMLTNTSTALSGNDDANNILTSVGFDLPGTMRITGGSAYVGVGSVAYYGTGNYGSGYDISAEFGYGQHAGWQNNSSNTLVDFVSANQAHTTRMGLGNLDGPPNGTLSGPQGGMWSSSLGLPNGLGVVQNSTRFVLTLSGGTLATLGFLSDGVAVEWGSDHRFGDGVVAVPVPGAALLGLVGLPLVARLRRRSGA